MRRKSWSSINYGKKYYMDLKDIQLGYSSNVVIVLNIYGKISLKPSAKEQESREYFSKKRSCGDMDADAWYVNKI